MGLTFVTRKYTCNECGHSDKAYVVMHNIKDIKSYFPAEGLPELVEGRLYKEILVRDEYGLTIERRAEAVPCDKCGSVNIEAEVISPFVTVSNFYPHGTTGQWFEGFAKHE